ncbi:fumarylacetoacetate hydrolase family protein [Polynucleobacter kasalickyi]|uniref:2-keto-4-pentenoate hydratase/2-oxohepta-3-ene-1,7-dioic acid hydratase (Catechol pathway) n=1 Tax=Polynucleobacter kasalickyi TaxID=1938817 RepID=A0A1W1Y2K9_9BURK|nr:fumarylacetoacetate hydrolase family protein [Polynucleobacter kasalickyi]SMC30377.1 2-keto-4-pentenoate hydratase/2-oxohepta-3-ene-1,7-dioic acid hydratase (catechol pathway) [Polynucleobacter kasalickyi]
MRWLQFSVNNKIQSGYLVGEQVHVIQGDFLDEWQDTGETYPLSAVKIEIPIIPRTFYAAGFNYAIHVAEIAKAMGEKPVLPTSADIGYRANNALIAHDEDVIIPADATEQVQYEGEIVMVIGKKVKNVSPSEALDCIFGYTIGNDVSERTWQKTDRTFFRCKNTDTFKPMGPWIETDFDIDQAITTIRVNGKQEIQFATKDMIFSFADFLSRASKYITFYPGDVMWMGTEGTSPNLVHNDVVEIEISGLGVLRNRFLKEGQ